MHHRSIICVSAILALTPLAIAQHYKVIELDPAVTPTSISKGVVAGFFGSPSHACLISKSRLVDVNPLGISSSGILGMAGNWAVGHAALSGLQAAPVVWIDQNLSSLNVPFPFVSGRATATDGRQVVGTAIEADIEGSGPQHTLLWDLGSNTVEDLGQDATVTAIGNGYQVGYQFSSQGSAACVWNGTRNSAVSLHPQFADASVATATDGFTHVGYVGVDIRVRHEGRPRDIRFFSAGYWTGVGDTFEYLGSRYRHSFALALSGDVIVGYGNTADAIGAPRYSHAVAWVGSNHQEVDLHSLLPATMQTSRAIAVDEDGKIVGYGVTQTGQRRSFLWMPLAIARH